MKEDDCYKLAFENISIGISLLSVNPLGKYIDVNPAFCRMTGYSRNELLGQDFQSITSPEDLEINLKKLDTLLSSAVPLLLLEKRYVRKNADSFWVRLHISLIKTSGKKPICLIVQIEDIDGYKRSEEQLIHYADIVKHIQVGLYVYHLEDINDDRTLRTIASNPAASILTGISAEDVLGKTMDENFPYLRDKNIPQLLAEVIRTQEPKEVEDFNYGDKRVLEGVWSFKAFPLPNHCVGVAFENITEKKRLEEQLRHAHKLEAIGRLAGGVAHEFNNLLTSIIGNLNIAQEQTQDNLSLKTLLETSEQAAKRAATLTQQLLAFSRKIPTDTRPQNLDSIAKEVVQLISQTMDRRIQVRVESDDDLWGVLADGSQMNQVIMNLFMNARDALIDRLSSGRPGPDSSNWHPSIRIKLQNIQRNEASCESHPNAEPGEYVCLSVSDNGGGIDERIRDRIFEPFFTDKEVGHGTGLGLATVYGIVKQHKGWIELRSTEGSGTTFEVYLLRTHEPVVKAPEISEDPARTSRNETILFVDDEENIRRLGQTILERLGYTIILAQDGREAIQTFSLEKKRINLVILDLTMPNQTGHEVLESLHQHNPELKIIVISGHSIKAVAKQFEEKKNVWFIQKPFDPAYLAQKVREVLDRAS